MALGWLITWLMLHCTACKLIQLITSLSLRYNLKKKKLIKLVYHVINILIYLLCEKGDWFLGHLVRGTGSIEIAYVEIYKYLISDMTTLIFFEWKSTAILLLRRIIKNLM